MLMNAMVASWVLLSSVKANFLDANDTAGVAAMNASIANDAATKQLAVKLSYHATAARMTMRPQISRDDAKNSQVQDCQRQTADMISRYGANPRPRAWLTLSTARPLLLYCVRGRNNE